MACQAFYICSDAAQNYLKEVKSERHLTERNIKSLEEAKQEIELLIKEFDKRNTQGENHESNHELLGQAH